MCVQARSCEAALRVMPALCFLNAPLPVRGEQQHKGGFASLRALTLWFLVGMGEWIPMIAP